MPSLELNRQFWDTTYDWSSQGAEWSSNWGEVETQWQGTILPRIRRHLPVHTILEIAPGFGRWTQFLAGFCKRLIVVDLSEKCISACRERFRDSNHIEYHVNDGLSLAFVGDNSVDFVFSFDSLVHVEANVIESYLSELGRILKPGGAGFIHHSNLAEYSAFAAIDVFLHGHRRLQAFARRFRLAPESHGRARSMSALTFRDFAERAGIHCISQEKVNWGGKRLIDCFSVIQKINTSGHHPLTTLHNPHFMTEARYLAKLSRLYSQPDTEPAAHRAKGSAGKTGS